MLETTGHRIIWPQPRCVAIETFSCPPPEANEVLVEAMVSLISPGTERAFFTAMPNTRLKFPALAVGYSHIGRIIATGDDVEGVAVGDIVASNARHVSPARLTADCLVKVSRNLDLNEAAFFNLLAIALQGVRKAAIEIGESACVIGQGLIGQFALQFARMNGAFPVAAVDPVESRLDLSRACGADAVINPQTENVSETAADLTDGRGFDVVIECTGLPEPIVDAFPLLARQGRLMLLGSPRGVSREVNFYPEIHARGISIIGAHADIRPARDRSRHYWTWKEDCILALQLLNSDRLQVRPMISDIFSWKDAAAAYDLLLGSSLDGLGIILDWRTG